MFNYTVRMGFNDFKVEVTGYEPATGDGWHEPYEPALVYFTVFDEEGNELPEGTYPLGLEGELLTLIERESKRY